MPDSDQNSTPSQAVTRRELYDMAWRMPMLRVAERFGVSSSYLARVFTELRIPRPPPGYWAQVEFGKSPARPDLPPARPGDLTEWSPGTSVGATVRSLTKVGQPDEKSVVPVAAQTASFDAAAPRSKRKARVSNAANQPKRHELLTGVDTRRISDFFRAAELRLNQGVEGTDPAALDRLRLAKDLIGQPDPVGCCRFDGHQPKLFQSLQTVPG